MLRAYQHNGTTYNNRNRNNSRAAGKHARKRGTRGEGVKTGTKDELLKATDI